MRALTHAAFFLALTAIVGPPAAKAYNFWQESDVTYTDRDVWTVDVEGYSCSYQGYESYFWMETISILHGSYSGYINDADEYGPYWMYPDGLCAYVEGMNVQRGQWLNVDGWHFWYWDYYNVAWYNTSWDGAHPDDIIPAGEVSYGTWYNGGSSLGGLFTAYLYPGGTWFQGGEVSEEIFGVSDGCYAGDATHGYGDEMDLGDIDWGGTWPVSSNGDYGDDQVTVAYDYASYYAGLYQGQQSCVLSFSQTMSIRNATGNFIPYETHQISFEITNIWWLIVSRGDGDVDGPISP